MSGLQKNTDVRLCTGIRKTDTSKLDDLTQIQYARATSEPIAIAAKCAASDGAVATVTSTCSIGASATPIATRSAITTCEAAIVEDARTMTTTIYATHIAIPIRRATTLRATITTRRAAAIGTARAFGEVPLSFIFTFLSSFLNWVQTFEWIFQPPSLWRPVR